MSGDGFTGLLRGLARRLGDPRDQQASWAVGILLICFDSLLTAAIIYKIPYTEIDWIAYMQEVEGWLGGECDYTNLRGDTGPLVYPAGFVYVFSGLRYVTGGAVLPAQIIFAAVYVGTLVAVVAAYVRAQVVPPFALVLLVLSKRIHSIYVLRLFNDCVAMLLFYLSLLVVQQRRWKTGLFVYSLAVSVKMNVLLMAPGLLMLMLKGTTLQDTILSLAIAAAVQVGLAWPFLRCNWWGYLTRSFDLGRKFIFHWSVNFKFLPEDVFLSRRWGLALLAVNLFVVVAFALRKWCHHEGGVIAAVAGNLRVLRGKQGGGEADALTPEHITTVLFSCNFLGVVCARSLHYQFYCWYYHMLPYLLWQNEWHWGARLAVMGIIEYCWNVFPSTPASSLLLLWCHLVLVADLWWAKVRAPTRRLLKKADVVAKKKGR